MANKNIKLVKGNLITKALGGDFDVIVHGCNCYSMQRAGIALLMSTAFGTDRFNMESALFTHPSEKLGNIDYETVNIPLRKPLAVVNAYTQEKGGANFDIVSFELCMYKLLKVFPNAHIGMPMIGAGIGGGDWVQIYQVIAKVFGDKPIKVTIVEYDGK